MTDLCPECGSSDVYVVTATKSGNLWVQCQTCDEKYLEVIE